MFSKAFYGPSACEKGRRLLPTLFYHTVTLNARNIMYPVPNKSSKGYAPATNKFFILFFILSSFEGP
jgi:hypothetical protein